MPLGVRLTMMVQRDAAPETLRRSNGVEERQ